MSIYKDYPYSIYNNGAGGGGGGEVVIGGRTYPTVNIGGNEWIAENLDYKFSGLVVGNSGTSSTQPRGNYYNNDEVTYGIGGNKYGLLYNWAAVNYLEANRSSLFPGWHVPSADEWDLLATAVGGASVAGTKLKSSLDWSSGAGTNDYGFSALPAGYYYGNFGGLGNKTNFWTSTEYDSNKAWYRGFGTGSSMDSYNPSNADQYSVRLVKDP
jgi:uncharacterized protein (TIGR02145 family)